jgi:CubicO group peptidase (beta-lactamase class C family)
MRRKPLTRMVHARGQCVSNWLLTQACLLIVFVLATPNVFSQSARSSSDDTASAIDREMSAVYKPDLPGAAVIVTRNGQVVFRKAYGLANLELNVPVKPEMVFRLCSVTKQFTAAAVMILIEQGKLSLNDDINKFFPDYPTGGRKITVENLLTHTSGVKDYLNKVWPNRISQEFKPGDLIELFKNDGLEFEPGTRADYSNSNYVLLGAIIEKLAGKDYGQFIEDQIFKPLGMKHSSYERVQKVIPNRVSGYLTLNGVYINGAYLSMSQLYAAGGLDSSVDDLALWDAAIDSDKLLKRSSWERIFTPYKLAGGESSPYAYGWVISQLQGRTIASHGGGIPGFRAYVLRIPEDHVYVALLAINETAETQPEYVARRIAAIAIGKPIIETKVIKLDVRVLDAYAGQYQAGADESLTVRRQGDQLFAQDPGNPEVELFPISEDTFIVKAFDARIKFVKDDRGKVTGVIESYGGKDLKLTKIK